MIKKGMHVVHGVCLRCFQDRVVGFNVNGRTDKVGTVIECFCSCQGGDKTKMAEHIVIGVT